VRLYTESEWTIYGTLQACCILRHLPWCRRRRLRIRSPPWPTRTRHVTCYHDNTEHGTSNGEACWQPETKTKSIEIYIKMLNKSFFCGMYAKKVWFRFWSLSTWTQSLPMTHCHTHATLLTLCALEGYMLLLKNWFCGLGS